MLTGKAAGAGADGVTVPGVGGRAVSDLAAVFGAAAEAVGRKGADLETLIGGVAGAGGSAGAGFAKALGGDAEAG